MYNRYLGKYIDFYETMFLMLSMCFLTVRRSSFVVLATPLRSGRSGHRETCSIPPAGSGRPVCQKATETYLVWAKEDYACIIFNLHVEHTPAGLERARRDFQCPIDLGLNCGGSYYLTYHRWARRNRIEATLSKF